MRDWLITSFFSRGGDAVEHRSFEAGLIDDGIEEQRRQHRRRCVGFGRLRAQLFPQLVGGGLGLWGYNGQVAQPGMRHKNPVRRGWARLVARVGWLGSAGQTRYMV